MRVPMPITSRRVSAVGCVADRKTWLEIHIGSKSGSCPAIVSQLASYRATPGKLSYQYDAVTDGVTTCFKQGTIPVHLQDVSIAFNVVEFAVIRSVVTQDRQQTSLFGKCHHPWHEPRTLALQLGAIVKVDGQLREMAVAPLVVLPPVLQGIDDEIAVLPGAPAFQPALGAPAF
jgi:hypothetical protein